MDAAQLFVPRAIESLRPELPTTEFADASGFAQMLQTPRAERSTPPRGQEGSANGNTERAVNGPDCERDCDEQSTRSPEKSSQPAEANSAPCDEAVGSSEDLESKHSDEENREDQTDDASREAAMAAGQAVALVQIKVQPDRAAATNEQAGSTSAADDVGGIDLGDETVDLLATPANSSDAIKATEVAVQTLPLDPVIDATLEAAADPSQAAANSKTAVAKKPIEHEVKPAKGKLNEKLDSALPDSPSATNAETRQEIEQLVAPGELAGTPVQTGAVNERKTNKEPVDSPPIEEQNLKTETNQQIIELNDARRAEQTLDAISVSQPSSEPNGTAPVHTPGSNPTGAIPAGTNASSAGTRVPNWLRGTNEGPNERGSVVVDSTRFLQRVTRAFEAAQSRGGNVRLRLSPPELGAVQIELRLHEGVLSARLEAENSSARSALLDSLPALKERLAEQGMRIENFEVNVGGRGNGGTPDRPQDRPEEQRTESVRRPRAATPGSSEAAARPRPWSGNGALNVMV